MYWINNICIRFFWTLGQVILGVWIFIRFSIAPKKTRYWQNKAALKTQKNIQIEVGYDTVRYFMFFLPFMSRVFWYFSDTYARIKSNVRSTLIFFFDRYTQVDIEFLVVVYTVFVCEAEVILLNVLCTQSNILSKPRFAFTDLCKW